MTHSEFPVFPNNLTRVSDPSNGQSCSLIGFVTRENAPQITPARSSRTWMREMAQDRKGWPNRCLPMLIANQSGWELRNPSAFTATWLGEKNGVDVLIAPAKRDPDQLLPVSHFGDGILTWHLPLLFRTPPGYNLLVRGPANYPKDAVCALEGIVETDWASASFSMSWKFTRKLMPVRFDVDEPICVIVPQRRGELERFVPELRCIASDIELQRKYEYFLSSRSETKRIEQTARLAAGEQVEWQGDYMQGRHTDGDPGAPDHQTRRQLRAFIPARQERPA